MRSETSATPRPALAARNANQRVGCGGADDHVRLLALDRPQHQAVALDLEAGALEVVAVRIPPCGRPQRCALEPWRRVGCPLERAERRDDEEERADERRDRVSGEPEQQRVAPRRKGDRLARPHRDAPEDLFRAELCEDAADEVVRADGDAARGDEDVRLETRASAALWDASSSSTVSRSSTTPCRSSSAESMTPFDS